MFSFSANDVWAAADTVALPWMLSHQALLIVSSSCLSAYGTIAFDPSKDPSSEVDKVHSALYLTKNLM